jgi:hypothetical protein
MGQLDVSDGKTEDEPESGEEQRRESSLRPGEVRLKPGGLTTVMHEEEAPEPPDDKRIHARRPLPLVPDKATEEREP